MDRRIILSLIILLCASPSWGRMNVAMMGGGAAVAAPSYLVQWAADDTSLDIYDATDGSTVTQGGASFVSGCTGNGMEILAGDRPYFTATDGNNINLTSGEMGFCYNGSTAMDRDGRFFQLGDDYDDFALYRSGNDYTWVFAYNGNITSINGSTEFENAFDGNSHTVKITWGSGTVTIQVDGGTVRSKAVTGTPTANGSTFYIGNHASVAREILGVIDDFYIK